jgi:DNA-binding response OmpR family regulator
MFVLYPVEVPNGAGGVSHPIVVVVDDDPPIVDLVCDSLKDEGIPASSCPYGRRAFACIRKKRPKVAILDIQMPEVDGIELFKLLRADPETHGLPVIFLTANAHLLQRHLPEYQQLGATVVIKPFDLDTLLDTVNHLLPN